MEDEDDPGYELSLDGLPFDCIVTLCEYLSAEDLARFGRVCTVFYAATQVGYLWRRLSLGRWAFCNVHQISDGPQRWKRYFTARRRVEARMDTGKPMRDYRVRTLRGHEKDIVSVALIGESPGDDINWESPSHPMVISLSSDGCVKAWDVDQGKEVWSLSNESIYCLAASKTKKEVALGTNEGSIQIWRIGEWSQITTLHGSGPVAHLMYTHTKDSFLPQEILLADTVDGTVDVWDCKAITSDVNNGSDRAPEVEAVKPVLKLESQRYTLRWILSHTQAVRWNLSSSGLLSLDNQLDEIQVFDLTSSSPSPSSSSSTSPLSSHVTLHTDNPITSSCWVEPRCLATASETSANISIWNVGSHLDALAKTRRVVYDQKNIYSPTKTIPNQSPPLTLGVVKGLLISGDLEGCLRVIDPKSGQILQSFRDHKGKMTDLFVDGFRVLSCSVDFSVRVYRWKEKEEKEEERHGSQRQAPQLESRYTLLGGSVALKQHNGFNRLLCSASSCVGVAGNQLKFYTFTANLQN